MSKEYIEALEPSVVLKFVDDLLKRYEGKTDYNIYITKDWLLEIKQSLHRLEAIDNAIEICKKANKQKYVYIKETYGIIKEDFLDDLDYEFFNNRLYVCSRGGYYDFPLKDYGNWWALTKEELKE